MYIKILQEADAQSYQDLRLHGLRTNPDAFGSTFDLEDKFSLETVIERIKPNMGKFVLGAFADNGRLVGIVTFIRENGVKTSHKGNVFGMYVTGDMRGKGVGKNLMSELIKNSKAIVGLEQINLTVVANNDSAKNLYKSLGFQIYGLERRALKHNEKYLDEELMVLHLAGSRLSVNLQQK